MLTLQISQQYAKLGIESTRAQLDLRQRPADLQIEQPAAVLEISQGTGKLEIDSTEGQSSLGYRSSQRMLDSVASQVRSGVLDAIGKIAEEGWQLAEISGPSIGDLALQKQNEGTMPIDYVGPYTGPYVKLSYAPHPLDIRVQPQKAVIQVTPHPVESQYSPGNVRTYVAQQNGLQIDVKGQYMNMEF
ncbi:DUF6470 family protein [Tumebacillus flagellatus]|uniref:Uncharacterized protein n=1 Tax=Tumebacillus flagellatus TaxID=1157490 RepID=A0A074LVK8_9BACL|nr:DUF6470 family protein [Tumebacillus flagellatus]KEO84068.1 hypothetical protein EL26_06285 [Tumebacillus flagellatus]